MDASRRDRRLIAAAVVVLALLALVVVGRLQAATSRRAMPGRPG